MHTLRSLYFSPPTNFEDAYVVRPDRRLAVSPQFQRVFSASCPFAVDETFLGLYPDLRGLVPELALPRTGRRLGSNSVRLLPQSGISPLAPSPGPDLSTGYDAGCSQWHSDQPYTQDTVSNVPSMPLIPGSPRLPDMTGDADSWFGRLGTWDEPGPWDDVGFGSLP
jgi:hypothetical protein